MKNSFTKNIRHLISAGHTAVAVDILVKELETIGGKIHNTAIILCSDWNELHIEKIQGTISRSDFNLAKSQIKSRILEFLIYLESQKVYLLN